MSSFTDTSGPLPPTLFSIYRTYKRETSTVINWLVSFDKTAGDANDDGKSALHELTVRQIADRARKAASTGTRPPKNIETAFKMVIVNRNKLTKHYESLSSSSPSIQDSTESHKVFNETLAEAYRLLFPKLKRGPRNAKKIPEESTKPSTKSCTNSFEALAGLIELEEEFDCSAFEFWQEEATVPDAKPSTIKEDCVGSSIALEVYIAELQAIIETIRTIWASFAAGEMTLEAAGWLTNMAQNLIIRSKQEGSNSNDLSRFLYSPPGTFGTGRPRDELETAEFSRIATSSSFTELTHGCGIFWPWELLDTFFRTQQLPDLPKERPRRFESFFRSASEERAAKESFAQSVKDWVSCNQTEIPAEDDAEWPSGDHFKEMAVICEDRYSHDRLLLASMIKSVSRLPQYEGCELQSSSDECQDHGLFLASPHIQRPDAMPLLYDVKKKRLDAPTLAAAHMLLESGRSFLHEFEKTEKPPRNCRIIVQSRANEVIGAIKDLSQGRPEVGLTKISLALLERLLLKLKTFVSERTFDLYSQSPWVAGSQMSGISDLSLFVGLEVLNDHDCFGAVIHLYNMLQQIGAQRAEIPILEHLKTLFKSQVFVCKQEPRRSFANMFELFCGEAKIYRSQEAGICFLTRKGPKTIGRGLHENARFSISKMSVAAFESFYRLYQFTPKFLDRLNCDTEVQQGDQRTERQARSSLRWLPSELIRRARDVVRPEYEGEFPIGRVNCFAVLGLCMDILLGIVTRFKALGTAAWPPEVSELIPLEIEEVSIKWAIECLCITMRVVDSCWDVESIRKQKMSDKDRKQMKAIVRSMRPVVIMRDVIAEVCKGKKVEDFLWKSA